MLNNVSLIIVFYQVLQVDLDTESLRKYVEHRLNRPDVAKRLSALLSSDKQFDT